VSTGATVTAHRAIAYKQASNTRKAVFVEDDLSAEVSQRVRMPLTPAMRPWAAIMIKAASPMSAPPKKELRGVNSVSISKLSP